MFRATSGTIALIAAGVVALLLLGDAVVRAGWAQMLLLAPWVLLVVWLIYVAMYASAIETDAAGATVQNFLRRTRVPWAKVQDIRLRYQVVFDLDDGRQLKAYGGPVAGRPVRDRGRMGFQMRREPPALRELALIQEQWETAREQGAPDTPVTRSWDLPALVALAVIAVGALVAVIITNAPA
ncbi:PH domain-containing protein [Microbacterium sp. 1P10UB]|uniref:PH domain-containing protein n=1 Tax=unclassified Microbacterium TaxID=2609290 RepID=UPI0039A06AAF